MLIFLNKASIVCCWLLFVSVSTIAQKQFSGKIIDEENHQPLENVSVIEINTSANTISGPDGIFSLAIGDTVRKISISLVGYETQVVTVPANSTIVLHKKNIQLKDVLFTSKSNTAFFRTLAKIDLDLKPVRNTQELLRLVPGLFIAQHAGGGKAEQIFLRGFDCDHGTDVRISVDGMPVNMVSHAHGQGYADAHFIIPETIQQIDFGAGPYYTSQGNLNTAGYVAFSTYTSIPSSRIQVEAGSFNTSRILLMLDLQKKNKAKHQAYLASEYNYTNGPTENKQHFNRLNVFGKFQYTLSSRTTLEASASAFNSGWDASGQIPERALKNAIINRFGSIDPSEGGQTSRYNANIIFRHRYPSGTVIESQAFYSRYQFNLFSNFTFFLVDTINGDGINQSESRHILGMQTKLSRKYFFRNLTLQSTYGTGVRSDIIQDSRLTKSVKRQLMEDYQLGNIRETNWFGYMQQQWQTGHWLFEGGLRYDLFTAAYENKLSSSQYPSRQSGILSPKLNIQYTVNPAWQVYLKAGKGFHSNDARVVVVKGGKDILPAAYSADLGFILKPSARSLVQVAAWQMNLQQEFIYVGDAGIVEPGGRTKRTGLDIIARYQFTSKIFANLNVNFTRPRAIDEPKGMDFIPLAPTVTSIGGLFYKPKTGLNGSIHYRFIKNRAANEDYSVTAKGYFILDASLNYSKKSYELGLSVENMLNAKWNEAQFDTESRLQQEPSPIKELHFTPGTPFFARIKLAVFF